MKIGGSKWLFYPTSRSDRTHIPISTDIAKSTIALSSPPALNLSIAVHKPDNKDGGAIEKVGVMRVISRKTLREFSEEHTDAREALYAWYRVASKATWQNLLDVQQIYPKAEAVGNFTVFNIKGNRYRLIVDIVYVSQRIYVKYVLTHAEYDKDEWKNDQHF